MNNKLIYLHTYTVQQDMRIRLPRSLTTKLSVEKGKTRFAIFLDEETQELLLRKVELPDEDES